MADELQEWNTEANRFPDPEEMRHVHSVIDSFRQYRRNSHLNATHVRRQNFYALPSAHWQLLSKPPISFLKTLDAVDEAIDRNADIAEAIAANALEALNIDERDVERGLAGELDLHKTRSTITQLSRDWSVDGQAERTACYEPVLQDLAEYLPFKSARVLVPGAGLGRLVFDICRAGHHAAGNEISYHQLLASTFMLNHTNEVGEWPLHPHAMAFSNNLTREDQLRQVRIPDVVPSNENFPGSMSMSAGDFCELYMQEKYKATFDAVATVFFIDTAPNLIAYIQTVANALKAGGLWINVGPLLWHFDRDEKGEEEPPSDDDNEGHSQDPRVEKTGISAPGSFEASNDEVLHLIAAFGFSIVKHEANAIETGYQENARSMLQRAYKPVHWVFKRNP